MFISFIFFVVTFKIEKSALERRLRLYLILAMSRGGKTSMEYNYLHISQKALVECINSLALKDTLKYKEIDGIVRLSGHFFHYQFCQPNRAPGNSKKRERKPYCNH